MPPKPNAPQANHGRGALKVFNLCACTSPKNGTTQFALGPTATTGVSLDGTWQYRQTIEFYRETADKVKPEQITSCGGGGPLGCPGCYGAEA